MRGFGQAALGAFLLTTGIGHLTFKRKEFQAQVPSWFPADKDTVVVVSGYVELALAAALLTTWRQPARRLLGLGMAGFFAGIFPGNIAQYTERNDGLGPGHRPQAGAAPARPASPDRLGPRRHPRPVLTPHTGRRNP